MRRCFSVVRFLHREVTVSTNETFELFCELTQDIWTEGVTISRRLRESDDTSNICSVNSSGSGICDVASLSANGTVNPPDTLTVKLSKRAECIDGGQYLCGPNSVPESKASITVKVYGRSLKLGYRKFIF